MQWQPTPVFLPGESQGRGSLVGCRLWGRTDCSDLAAAAAAEPGAVGNTHGSVSPEWFSDGNEIFLSSFSLWLAH